jgi:hypothetical protein
MRPPAYPLNTCNQDFDHMIEAWLPFTYLLNNLDRSLGLPDSYPFLLSTPVITKLRFIHETPRCRQSGQLHFGTCHCSIFDYSGNFGGVGGYVRTPMWFL